MSRIIKSGQTVYQDLEVAVYGETFESTEEEDGPAAQEESYTLISEEKRHILEHARNQARESMAEILSDAYAQRDKIVNTAEKEAVRIREQGHEQGLEEALSSVEDLTVRLRQEIGEAYERMENQLEDIRSQIVELSLDIAGKILEKRIEEDSGEMAELVKKAIQSERDKKKIDIHISAKALELAEALHVVVVDGDGGSDLTLALGHVHVADVELLDRHAALDELERVLRRVEHDEDLLGRGGLVDHVDGLLDGEEAGLNTGRSSHLHEVLAHGVRGDLVVGNEDEVGTQGGVPLGGNLTVDQSIVDTGEKDIGLCHCDPSFRIRVLAFTT